MDDRNKFLEQRMYGRDKAKPKTHAYHTEETRASGWGDGRVAFDQDRPMHLKIQDHNQSDASDFTVDKKVRAMDVPKKMARDEVGKALTKYKGGTTGK